MGSNSLLKFSWIIPIGENEDGKSIENCLLALSAIVGKDDQVIVVAPKNLTVKVQSLLTKFNCDFLTLAHPVVKRAGAARNLALAHRHHDRIIFQDVDDVPQKNRRELMAQLLTQPKTIATTGYLSFFDGIKIGTRIPKKWNSFFYFRTNIFLPTSGVFFEPNDDFYFDEIKIGEDTLFFANLMAHGYSIVSSREITIEYNISSKKVASKRGINGIIDEIRFRFRLFGLAKKKKHKTMVLLGGVVFCGLKTLPTVIFQKLYYFGHRSG